MRSARNNSRRTTRSSSQFSDQDRYANYNQRGRNSGTRNYDRLDHEARGPEWRMGQDYNQEYARGNYGRGDSQNQNHGSDFSRGFNNEYGGNSYTENERYNQNRYLGDAGDQSRFDQNYRSNDSRRNQGSETQYGQGDYSGYTQRGREEYGRMGGNYGRSEESNRWGEGHGSSSFDTNQGGRWGSSVESMRGKGPKGYHRSDERIQEQLNDSLTDDDTLDASGIEVTVKNGEVTLSGTVDSREAKRRAEDIAEGISGVSNVENRIRVSKDASEPGLRDRDSHESDKARSGQNKSRTHQNAEA